MNWKVGDRAVIDCPDSRSHGNHTMILACGIRGYSGEDTYIGYRVSEPCHSNPEGFCIFEHHELRPIDDSNEAGSWSDCVWKPMGVEV